MTTADVLLANNIVTALIVDDGYDTVPKIADLNTSTGDWATFFDDLSLADKELLDDAYEGFDLNFGIGYARDEAFLSIVWGLREHLSEAVNHILESYVNSQRETERVLREVKEILESFGLNVETAGREFSDAARQVDLILIDLYLGSQHSADDMEQSIGALRNVIMARADNPPVIILMSSNENVFSKRGKFRDEAGVYASGFRVIKKSDFNREGRFEQLLFELAQHRNDSLILTNFIEKWQHGIKNAIESTSVNIRRLDLEDIKQLHDLLLRDEQALGGSYFLDLVDRLLLHEIEADMPTIYAAKKLNEMNSREYPPNTITRDKSNLDLVYKTIYAHPNRRELDPEGGYRVGFGDIIALKRDAVPPLRSIFSGDSDKNSVFVVMTPACDLVRKSPAAKSVLLLEGERKSVDAVAYLPPLPKDSRPRTIVLECDGQRFGVEWKTKNLLTQTKAGIDNLLEKEGVVVAGRLRGEYALELQQALLSGLGRVGNMAPMPLNYPVVATVYYPNNNRDLVRLGINLDGICVVGRFKNTKKSRIGFDSSQRYDFADKLREEINQVHEKSRSMVGKCLSIECINTLFTMGFDSDIKKASERRGDCILKIGSRTQKIGTVVYNKKAEHVINDLGAIQSAGLIFQIDQVGQSI